jgi:hypothetical protein
MSRFAEGFDLASGAPDVIGVGGRRAKGTPLEFPAELFPPRDSRALVLTDTVNLAGGAGTSAKPAGLHTKLELGFVAIIRSIQIFADAPDLTTRATWRILINGAPVAGLENLTMIFRAASSIARDFDTLRVEVPDGAEVDVQITNVDGVPRIYGAQLVGWQWQVDE